jgi:sulfite reductase (ferredoxin)
MSDISPPHPGRARRTLDPVKPQGQWAVDGRDPLNHAERVKAIDPGLAVRSRIESVYSVHGVDSIDPDDLNIRFRWWGLYTQRKPGITGAQAVGMDAADLADSVFMLRVRLDGGAVDSDQARALADISRTFADGTADLTDRQNVQFHHIRIEDVPRIWQRLEAVGLTTAQACGDTARVILGSPVAGISAAELLDPTPTIREITDRFLGDPDLANLPRKFKTAVTGHPSLDVAHEINDLSLVTVRHPDLGVGYDLWVGGGLSTDPHLAERLGAFVPPQRAAEVWHGVVRLFRDHGYRRVRRHARLKFLLRDWGPARFREVLENDYLESPLPDGPAPAPAQGPADHIGVHEQKDGLRYVGFAPTVGRISGDVLAAVVDLAEAAGSHRLRFTPQQKLLALDVVPDRVDDLLRGMDALGLSASPGPFRRSTMACTGIQFCKLAVAETKQVATEALTDLDDRLADVDLDVPISLHINGCPNSCARIQTADIGLKGQLLPGPHGPRPGYQVHLGGGLASSHRDEAGLGRTVRGLRIGAEDVADYVERLVRRFVDERQPAETFATWVHRSDEEALR